MSTPPIEVLIVNDSGVVCMLLEHLLEGDPRLQVAGAVDGGKKALEFLAGRRADVVLMDIHMQGMDGFEATRRIMETRPLPVVMCCAVGDPRAVATVFRAYEAGAVAVVEKPAGVGHPAYERLARELRDAVRLMSEVKVIRRWPRDRRGTTSSAVAAPAAVRAGEARVVGIGASTGGPPALQTLFGALPKDFPAPILVVQHITAGFLPGLAEWLSQTTPLQVQIAVQGLQALPGHVYLAPDDLHLGLGGDGRILLSRGPAESGLRPAVDCLFRSISQCRGADAVGVLLTGMGRDGARELKTLRDRGGATIAQDEATSVVNGMPGAAVALGAADQVLPIDKIAEALCRVVVGQQTWSRT